MRVRTSTVSAAIAAALLLAGCGGSSEKASSSGGACDDGDKFLVGSILPITGVTADTGLTITKGAEIAAKELNAAGGINGRCISLIAKDEGNDPTKAAQAASELIDRNEVSALIGPAGSGSAGAVAPIASEAGVPFFFAASLKLERKDAPLGFGIQITSDLIGPSFVEHAKSVGWKSLAVLAVNNTFGTMVLDSTVAAAKEAGIDVVKTEVHESGAVDLSPQVRSLRDKNPDALVVASFGADAVSALKARVQLGWEIPVIGPSGLSFDEVVNGAGKEGIDGVLSSMYPRPLAADPTTGAVSEAGEKLRKDIKAKEGGKDLTINLDNVGLGYDAIKAVAAAFNGAKSDDADKAGDYLIANGYKGVRADYSWDSKTTAGFPLAANSIVVAASLKDGVLTVAK